MALFATLQALAAPARQGWRIFAACRGSGEHAGAHQAGAYLPAPKGLKGPAVIFLAPRYRQARLELTDQGMVSYALKTAYRDETTHVVLQGRMHYLLAVTTQ